MNYAAIKAMNENLANALKGLKEGEKYTNSVEGALGIITKYWNKGYNTFFQNVGKDLQRPKDVSRYVRGLIKGEGRHTLMGVSVADKKGISKVVIGVWGQKALTDDAVTVVDANGRATHPYVKGADGKPVKVDYIRPVTKWTPAIVCQIVVQNVALEMGHDPYTEADYYFEHAPKVAAPKTKKPQSKKNVKKNSDKKAA